ncbi:MAG: arsenite methyltransferase [Fimbriimonadia bacterium]|jgi:SAM-dependent methyltransferase
MADENDRSEQIEQAVRERYAGAALHVISGEKGSCCGSGGCDPITADLYSRMETETLPEQAVLASLGCGNPTALAELREGETVLDLGSGGGIDVLLSAKRVGPSGFAYGLDMTDEMLDLAERNREAAGLENVRFLKGHIEAIPLPDDSVDVIISNCVINLSADKDRVFAEAFRVLRPGGRFAVSDVVVEGELPEAVRKDMELFVGCIAGALERTDYVRRLEAAGFIEVSVEPTRRYTFADAESVGLKPGALGLLDTEERLRLDGGIMAAFIRARKPHA